MLSNRQEKVTHPVRKLHTAVIKQSLNQRKKRNNKTESTGEMTGLKRKHRVDKNLNMCKVE